MQACNLIVFFAWVYKGGTKSGLTLGTHKNAVVLRYIPVRFESIFSIYSPLMGFII